jgi:[ribosomal protein S18]-alanine N-acetyltransferase
VKLTIRSASAETFAEMATWRYEPPYDFYDGDVDPVLNPERFYEALDEDGPLVGNYYFEQKGDSLEIGLGLRPDLTGRGLGLEFLLAGIEFGRRRFGLSRVILNVAAFNERAIKLYERARFREIGRHTRRFDR